MEPCPSRGRVGWLSCPASLGADCRDQFAGSLPIVERLGDQRGALQRDRRQNDGGGQLLQGSGRVSSSARISNPAVLHRARADVGDRRGVAGRQPAHVLRADCSRRPGFGVDDRSSRRCGSGSDFLVAGKHVVRRLGRHLPEERGRRLSRVLGRAFGCPLSRNLIVDSMASEYFYCLHGCSRS